MCLGGGKGGRMSWLFKRFNEPKPGQGLESAAKTLKAGGDTESLNGTP
jgi:hypothetical protein